MDFNSNAYFSEEDSDDEADDDNVDDKLEYNEDISGPHLRLTTSDEPNDKPDIQAPTGLLQLIIIHALTQNGYHQSKANTSFFVKHKKQWYLS